MGRPYNRTTDQGVLTVTSWALSNKIYQQLSGQGVTCVKYIREALKGRICKIVKFVQPR